jgi:hypothetical protein
MSAGVNQTITASAGQMTLYAEFYDSVSNQLIGRVVDPETVRGFGDQFMAQNRVTNKLASLLVGFKAVLILCHQGDELRVNEQLFFACANFLQHANTRKLL